MSKNVIVNNTSKEQIEAEAKAAEEKMDLLISNAKNAGIDIDKIASIIQHEFRIGTEHLTKDYFKLAKKQKNSGNDTQILKFTRDRIVPVWKKHLEGVDPSIKDIIELLEKKTFNYYVSGIFIIIHSTEIPNINKKVKATVAEMAAYAVKNAIDKGLIKQGDVLPD